jgi:hypothetical protein
LSGDEGVTKSIAMTDGLGEEMERNSWAEVEIPVELGFGRLSRVTIGLDGKNLGE